LSAHESQETCYLETRLTKLEWKAHEHGEEIREVKKTALELSKALRDISACLQQIKFTAFGAVAMFLASQLGLTEAISIVMSK